MVSRSPAAYLKNRMLRNTLNVVLLGDGRASHYLFENITEVQKLTNNLGAYNLNI